MANPPTPPPPHPPPPGGFPIFIISKILPPVFLASYRVLNFHPLVLIARNHQPTCVPRMNTFWRLEGRILLRCRSIVFGFIPSPFFTAKKTGQRISSGNSPRTRKLYSRDLANASFALTIEDSGFARACFSITPPLHTHFHLYLTQTLQMKPSRKIHAPRKETSPFALGSHVLPGCLINISLALVFFFPLVFLRLLFV